MTLVFYAKKTYKQQIIALNKKNFGNAS